MPKFAVAKKIPADLAEPVRVAFADSQRDRIRQGVQTVDGTAIDRNSPGWEKAKRQNRTPEQAIGSTPGLYTGVSTRRSSWSARSAGDRIIVEAVESAEERIRSFVGTGQARGRNWDRVFGISEAELIAVTQVFRQWLRENIEKILKVKK